jgi:cytochrome c553
MGLGGRISVVACAVAGGLFFRAFDVAAPPAFAQGAAKPDAVSSETVMRGRAVWKKSDCASCHGWAGHGRETEPIPPAPSLRQTELEADQIREVAQCGRPSTTMPSHDRLAYTDTRCYGMTREVIGKQRPPIGNALQPAELDDLAAYISTDIKGKGTVTRAECEIYNGQGAAVCSYYP